MKSLDNAETLLFCLLFVLIGRNSCLSEKTFFLERTSCERRQTGSQIVVWDLTQKECQISDAICRLLFYINKLSLGKKFIRKFERLNVKQRRSRLDSSLRAVSSALSCLQKPIIIACGSERQSIYAWFPIKWALANSVDPDQTTQYGASDQSLHCLH